MRIPRKIHVGDTIGVTATSEGNYKTTDLARLDNAQKQFENKGYHVILTDNVKTNENGRSSDGKTRALQLDSLVQNPEIPYIITARGGEFLCEMLPYVDFEAIRKNPKWIQGYSDTTGIVFTVTTNCDIATVYTSNFSDFGMENWHDSLEQNLQILEGKRDYQKSFDLCEETFSNRVTGLEGFDLVTKVEWKNATGEDKIEMKGRLLGGCMDVLLNLCGTKYDKTKEFIERYKEDKIIWYLESFNLDSEFLLRGLWQLREAGWFDTAAGFVFGRPMIYNSYANLAYEEVVLSMLKECNVPIITNADIGHKAPQFTMVNGAMATITAENGKGMLKYHNNLEF